MADCIQCGHPRDDHGDDVVHTACCAWVDDDMCGCGGFVCRDCNGRDRD